MMSTTVQREVKGFANFSKVVFRLIMRHLVANLGESYCKAGCYCVSNRLWNPQCRSDVTKMKNNVDALEGEEHLQ